MHVDFKQSHAMYNHNNNDVCESTCKKANTHTLHGVIAIANEN